MIASQCGNLGPRIGRVLGNLMDSIHDVQAEFLCKIVEFTRDGAILKVVGKLWLVLLGK